jgi:dipeptidyl aminopeptidase/acylaminoacyl peptidase
MFRPSPGLLLAVVLLSPPADVRSADIPESLLPPMVRPAARVQLASANPNQRAYYRSQFGGTLVSAVFSRDGKYVAAADPQGGGLHLHDAVTGKILRTLGAQVGCMAFSPDSKTLAITQTDNQNLQGIHLIDTATGKELKHLDEGANEMAVSALAWSADGSMLALSGTNQLRGGQPILTLWDAGTGDEIRRLTGPVPVAPVAPINRRQQATGMVESLAFAPDGKSLVLIVDRHIHLVELTTGKLRGQVAVVASSHPREDDEMMMMMRMQGRMVGTAGSNCLAVSPDGRLIAVGCPDETIRLFEVLTGKELPPLSGHRGGILTVGFSPDGKTLRSVGTDAKMLVWRIDGPFRAWQPRGEKLAPEVLTALWEGLRGEDPWLNHAILANLAAVPDQTVTFLRERLRPAPQADADRIVKLAADVQNEDYNTRKKALVQLRKLGEAALPALRDAQTQGNTQILNMLVMRLEAERRGDGPEQDLMAVDVLARIGTEEARTLLAGLAKGAPAAAITQRAQAAMDSLTKVGAAKSEPKLEKLWADLGTDDPLRSYIALKALALRPKESVPMLRQRLGGLLVLKGVDDDPRRIEKLVANLDHDDFAVRENATEELKRLGARAEKQLRHRLKDGATAESAKRIEELIKEIVQPTPTQEAFWLERGLETLERIGLAEARETLQELAKEATNRQTQDQIKATLQRLEALADDKPR